MTTRDKIQSLLEGAGFGLSFVIVIYFALLAIKFFAGE